MRVFVVVNHVHEISYRQTTAMLIAALARQGCDVYLADVDGFTFASENGEDNFTAKVCELAVCADQRESTDSQTVEAFVKSDPKEVVTTLEPGDLIFIRTNPGDEKEARYTIPFCTFVAVRKLAEFAF